MKTGLGKLTMRYGVGLALIACLALTGCARSPQVRMATVAAYQPANIYRPMAKMPAQVRRVAVLPVSYESGDWEAEAGRDEVEPVLRSELGKARSFELVMVPSAQLRAWTSRPLIKADEPLPPVLLEQLTDTLGCDAVLFTHLRPYRPYPPLVMGWNLKLVELAGRSILWSADEVFDAGDPAVAKAAQQYYRAHQSMVHVREAPETVLVSPKRFSQYTLAALLGTLPER